MKQTYWHYLVTNSFKNNKPLLINMNNIFQWKVTIFQNKKMSEKSCIVLYFLQISLMFGLIEDSYILISASMFNLVQ